MSDPNNRAKAYMEKNERREQKRRENPEKARAIVREYVRKFRERLKAKKEATLRKVEVNKKVEATKMSKSMIDNIIETGIKSHANRERVKSHRTKKETGDPTRTYNLRSRK